MEKTLDNKVDYKGFKDTIMNQLDVDINQVKGKIVAWADVEEVATFTRNWESNQNSNASTQLDTNFYKETWKTLLKFNKIIEESLPPSYENLGTIMLETLTLRKQLQEMPRKIKDSIRQNVTQTMETQTKVLRDELVRTKDVLEPTPHTLNVYVEQVNTLKYID